jgi:hypothetical protein
MYYDSRFFTRDDMWHRFYELAGLVVLATAVLHIRPVSILSDSGNNIDMFAYCLSIAIGNCLAIGRMVEILISVEGEPAAKVVARRDIVLILGSTFFFVAAAVVAGVKYYATDTDGHDRFLAAASEAPYEPVDYYDTPIWLVIVGCLMNWVTLVSVLLVCIPSGENHRE